MREIAELIQEIVGFEGRLIFDLTKPDGTPGGNCAGCIADEVDRVGAENVSTGRNCVDL